VDDIVEGIVRLLNKPPSPATASDHENSTLGYSQVAPYAVYNIGCGQPVNLMRYIEVLEECLGRKAKKNLKPMQAGDVLDTCADVTKLSEVTGYAPKTSVEEGLARFSQWYKSYYGYDA